MGNNDLKRCYYLVAAYKINGVDIFLANFEISAKYLESTLKEAFDRLNKALDNYMNEEITEFTPGNIDFIDDEKEFTKSDLIIFAGECMTKAYDKEDFLFEHTFNNWITNKKNDKI